MPGPGRLPGRGGAGRSRPLRPHCRPARRGAGSRPRNRAATTRAQEDTDARHPAFLAALPALIPALASAQPAWPTRPVTLVVPWAAGGGADTVTRFFAQGLERELGQPVNVVNRTGGNGITGHAAIANAAPDGYTIGTGTSDVNFRVLGLADFGAENLDLLSRLATIPAGVTVQASAPGGTSRPSRRR
ncbi:Bug family tripartite tricarboxylate transporter substrate binding protein [Paeniroseomonas aquatica]|uniref:Bug family tripartite tricarboxylate transporter substrate binding protein n=1 Tax=Paeniroseomonas aquatica TaxID=373043 RepID=UPI00360FCE1F